MINFIHVRKYHVDGFGCVVVDARSGKTIAYELQPINKNEFELVYGIARCSKADNYNKKTGRELAKFRMQSAPYRINIINTDFRDKMDKRQIRISLEQILQRVIGNF
jgi:hypothetical protein